MNKTIRPKFLVLVIFITGVIFAVAFPSYLSLGILRASSFLPISQQIIIPKEDICLKAAFKVKEIPLDEKLNLAKVLKNYLVLQNNQLLHEVQKNFIAKMIVKIDSSAGGLREPYENIIKKCVVEASKNLGTGGGPMVDFIISEFTKKNYNYKLMRFGFPILKAIGEADKKQKQKIIEKLSTENVHQNIKVRLQRLFRINDPLLTNSVFENLIKNPPISMLPTEKNFLTPPKERYSGQAHVNLIKEWRGEKGFPEKLLNRLKNKNLPENSKLIIIDTLWQLKERTSKDPEKLYPIYDEAKGKVHKRLVGLFISLSLINKKAQKKVDEIFDSLIKALNFKEESGFNDFNFLISFINQYSRPRSTYGKINEDLLNYKFSENYNINLFNLIKKVKKEFSKKGESYQSLLRNLFPLFPNPSLNPLIDKLFMDKDFHHLSLDLALINSSQENPGPLEQVKENWKNYTDEDLLYLLKALKSSKTRLNKRRYFQSSKVYIPHILDKDFIIRTLKGQIFATTTHSSFEIQKVAFSIAESHIDVFYPFLSSQKTNSMLPEQQMVYFELMRKITNNKAYFRKGMELHKKDINCHYTTFQKFDRAFKGDAELFRPMLYCQKRFNFYHYQRISIEIKQSQYYKDELNNFLTKLKDPKLKEMWDLVIKNDLQTLRFKLNNSTPAPSQNSISEDVDD